MGKAKAAQMSRQLVMRLSYARLKVDHGWHKQNLNEVENLYFHHIRATKPTRPPSPLPPPTYNSDELAKEGEPPTENIEVEQTNQDNSLEGYQPPISVPQPEKTPPRTPSPVERPSVGVLNGTNPTSRLNRATPQLPWTSSDLVPQPSPPSTPIPAKVHSAIPPSPYNPLRTPPSTNHNLAHSTSPHLSPSIIRDVQAGNSPSLTTSPVPGMTYDSFWSSMSITPQTTYKSSLASAPEIGSGVFKSTSKQTTSNPT